MSKYDYKKRIIRDTCYTIFYISIIGDICCLILYIIIKLFGGI